MFRTDEWTCGFNVQQQEEGERVRLSECDDERERETGRQGNRRAEERKTRRRKDIWEAV